MAVFTPIQSVTLTSAQSTVTFSNLDQSYTDLQIVMNAAVSSGTADVYLKLGTNSIDTGTNYGYSILRGNGSAVAASSPSNTTYIDLCGATAINTTFGFTSTINLMNYSNSIYYKNAIIRSTNAANGSDAINGTWRSTTPINVIQLSPSASTFSAGSTFSLYGIRAGGTSKASGGDLILTDSTYWYHVFFKTGVFTPAVNGLSCDYLVIAGGGGGVAGLGSYTAGGGGGAGGLRSTVGATGGGGTLESAITLGSTPYPVLVGAGGAAGNGASAPGSNGGYSSLGSIVSIGGGGASSFAGSPTGYTIGNTGGSGGGSSGNTSSGGAGTPGQGYAGAANAGGVYPGSGGGAASAATAGGPGTAGGALLLTSWATATSTGVSSYYAGGGGGGAYGARTGSTGGGGGAGNGGSGTTNGGTATPNTGSGGGGAGNSGSGTSYGGNGASGLVIVRYHV